MAMQFWYERDLNWVILFIYNHSAGKQRKLVDLREKKKKKKKVIIPKQNRSKVKQHEIKAKKKTEHTQNCIKH